jgi:hypothetical protein
MLSQHRIRNWLLTIVASLIDIILRIAVLAIVPFGHGLRRWYGLLSAHLGIHLADDRALKSNAITK